MSSVFVPTSHRAGKPGVTPETIQNMLDENSHLIKCIVENQQKGRIQECAEYQRTLHRNLVWLATVADSNQSSGSSNMFSSTPPGGKPQNKPVPQFLNQTAPAQPNQAQPILQQAPPPQVDPQQPTSQPQDQYNGQPMPPYPNQQPAIDINQQQYQQQAVATQPQQPPYQQQPTAYPPSTGYAPPNPQISSASQQQQPVASQGIPSQNHPPQYQMQPQQNPAYPPHARPAAPYSQGQEVPPQSQYISQPMMSQQPVQYVSQTPPQNTQQGNPVYRYNVPPTTQPPQHQAWNNNAPMPQSQEYMNYQQQGSYPMNQS